MHGVYIQVIKVREYSVHTLTTLFTLLTIVAHWAAQTSSVVQVHNGVFFTDISTMLNTIDLSG